MFTQSQIDAWCNELSHLSQFNTRSYKVGIVRRLKRESQRRKLRNKLEENRNRFILKNPVRCFGQPDSLRVFSEVMDEWITESNNSLLPTPFVERTVAHSSNFGYYSEMNWQAALDHCLEEYSYYKRFCNEQVEMFEANRLEAGPEWTGIPEYQNVIFERTKLNRDQYWQWTYACDQMVTVSKNVVICEKQYDDMCEVYDWAKDLLHKFTTFTTMAQFAAIGYPCDLLDEYETDVSDHEPLA